MAKHNKVSTWLQSKSEDQAASLMCTARKSAKVLRAKHRLREQEVIKAVRNKLLENAAAQHALELKAAATKKQLIEDVMSHGGPCRSPSDVRNLQSSLSQKDLLCALKNEIRYQKVILGIPGVLKLSKSAKELAADLCRHLRCCSSKQQLPTLDDRLSCIPQAFLCLDKRRLYLSTRDNINRGRLFKRGGPAMIMLKGHNNPLDYLLRHLPTIIISIFRLPRSIAWVNFNIK